MPAIRASLLAVLALISCALALDLARAQDPTTETDTTLHPGLNLIGWTAEPTPTSQLFDEIPQLEAVWAWDAELDDWITAARGAPEWLGGLGRLTPGMGLRMQLSGDQPYHWQRSTEPTRGLVKLRTGWNLVAWSGADQTPIDDALKGIGWSLRTVHRWNPITQQWGTWTSPARTAKLIAADNTDQNAQSSEAEAATNGEAETPTIRRGEALWINVARAVNWLQPTDILPRLVFPGGASDKLQARAREDLEAVLNFYRTQYGIQADLDFTIYAAKDVDALLQAYRDDGQDVDDAYEASTRARWNRVAGWAGGNIVVKQTSWPDDLSTDDVAWARYTITHEYFHILQDQLSDGWASQWLVEGTASWIDDEHKVLDGEQTWSDLRDGLLSAITADTPTLRSVEGDNAQWEYTLGWLAIDRLTANAAPDFSIEFWRQLAPTGIGPHGRWASTPDWRTALQQVSGQTVSEFYTDFDAWQQEQATANPASASPYDGASIRGRVMGAGGEPVAGVFVNAIRVEGETSVGWNQRAETDANGRFAVRALEDSDYRLSVDINDDCTRYYADGQLISDGEQWDVREEARSVKVSQSDVTGIDIQLPPNVCGWQIRGRIVGPNAEPLAGIRVSACQTDRGLCRSSDSAADGSFAVAAERAGRYHLSLDLTDGCSAYYETGRVITELHKATLIKIVDNHIQGLLLRVSEGTCVYQIKGSITQTDGQPLADTDIWWQTDGQPLANTDIWWSCCSAQTNGSGAFAFTVPAEGEYGGWFSLGDCNIYFSSDGLTTAHSERSTVRVEGRDVRLNPLTIPADGCERQINGRLVGLDGEPQRGVRVSICVETRGNCSHGSSRSNDTGGDGSFVFAVRLGGTYRLTIRFGSCTLYYQEASGVTAVRAQASQIYIVDNTHLHIRANARMCAQQIKGTVTSSNGAPLAGVSVTACRPTANDGCADAASSTTSSDGSYAIIVPADGEYALYVARGACNVYFRRDGVTKNWQERSTVRVDGRRVQMNPRQIPDGLCAYRISGRLVDSSGAPVALKDMDICASLDCSRAQTEADGRFAISVSNDGAYSVGVWPADLCYQPLAGEALGSPDNPIRVSGADVTGVELRLPGTVEELCK